MLCPYHLYTADITTTKDTTITTFAGDAAIMVSNEF